MKKLFALFLLLTLVACNALDASLPLGESNFPLKQTLSIPFHDVQQIAVSDTWAAVQTTEKIIAVDLDTQRNLWSIDFSAFTGSSDSKFRIVEDSLVAASRDQIIVISKSGVETNIKLDAEQEGIVRVVAVYPNYIYVIQGSVWKLVVYEISDNRRLWKTPIGKGGADVFFDPTVNIAYVASNVEDLRAFDNSTGELLWRYEGNFLRSVFDLGVIYAYQKTRVRNHYRLTAIDVKSRQELWGKDLVFQPATGINKLTVIDNLLIASTGLGLIAFDKSSGDEVWHTDTVSAFFSSPVLFNNITYAKSSSGSVVVRAYSVGPVPGLL